MLSEEFLFFSLLQNSYAITARILEYFSYLGGFISDMQMLSKACGIRCVYEDADFTVNY